MKIQDLFTDFYSATSTLSTQVRYVNYSLIAVCWILSGQAVSGIKEGYSTIFYPCMTYNIDENLGDNHFNCPVVAYYPQQILNNVGTIDSVTFIHDFISIHNREVFENKIHELLKKYYKGISKSEIKEAASLAYNEYDNYLTSIRLTGREYIRVARENKMPIVVLAGRPYHVDPEVNHGIDKLIAGFGVTVVSEDSISDQITKFQTGVLNQWTYHSRLYAAAKYCTQNKDINLIQLVSFGCGLAAVTTDDCKDILERHGKIYTQIKIDEITNLGAVKIRLRSLFAALKQEDENAKH